MPSRRYKWVDEESGYPYYYNAETEESTYDRPAGFATVADPFASVRGGVEGPDKMSARRADSQLPVEAMTGGWVKYVDPESGHPYYYNETTEESTYDRPAGF